MNWKQIIWIVIYATIVVVIRQNGGIESNWVWWILALVFVAIYGALATKKDQQQQATDTPQNADSSTQNLAAVPQKDNDADSEESSKEALPESEGGYPLSIMSKIIREYCAECYDKMIDFHITLDTNFQKDLHFDGIDFAEICIRLEKEFSVELPEDSSLNNRPAEDTDFTVGEFLKEYRLLGGKSCDKASDSANDIRTDDIMSDKSDHAQKQIITKDFNVNGISFRMICVKGGFFVMGENQEDFIPHKVTIDKDYWIGETPVTQELWNAVMGYNNSHAYLKLNNAPVGNVSWLECEKFINTLSKITGKTFSFPTEAQWEFAARGGIFSKGYCYSGGDNIDDVAWYWDNCDKKVHAVKTKKPNELGIYDMSGSVWEWCYDWADKYDGKDVINPTGPEDGEYKIIRGGCLENNSPACTVTARSLLPPTKNHPLAGLRLAFSESSENSISESPNHNRADDVMAKNDLSANVQQSTSKKDKVPFKTSYDIVAPAVSYTKSVVHTAHCIDLPFISQFDNSNLDTSIRLKLSVLEKAVTEGNMSAATKFVNDIQTLVQQKFGGQQQVLLNGVPDMYNFKFNALSIDLLNLFRMVILGERDEEALDGIGSIRRILKYSIELGAPAQTLNMLTEYFMNNEWFTTLPEKHEWMKLALECMMVTGNGELGNTILSQLRAENNITDDEIEELREHADSYSSRIDISWMN